ncbi:unnamed protein product [Amoebophrya sp. A120]|nr:unnamed protein product [Amoebophrya sp. A120]|eukprot:GSA120T00002283001.1
MLLPPIGLTKPTVGGKHSKAPEFPEAERKVSSVIRHKYNSMTSGGSGPSTRRGSQSSGAIGLSTSVSMHHQNSSARLQSHGGLVSSGSSSNLQPHLQHSTSTTSLPPGASASTSSTAALQQGGKRFPLTPQPITGLENYTLEEYERIYAMVSDDYDPDERRGVSGSGSSGEEGSKISPELKSQLMNFERINAQDLVANMDRDMRNIREFKNFQFGKPTGLNTSKTEEMKATQSGGMAKGSPKGGGQTDLSASAKDEDPNKHKTKQDIVMGHVDERRALKPAALAELQLQVPFTNYKIPGTHESLELVDVRKLAEGAMCMGMSGGAPTLEQLMAAYKRKQKEMQYEDSATSVNFLRKNKLGASVYGHASRSRSVPSVLPLQVEEEEWYVQAWYRRKYLLRDRIEHKKLHSRTYKKAQRDAAAAILREAAEEILMSQRKWFVMLATWKFLASIDELRNSKELRRLKMQRRKKAKAEKASVEGGDGGEGGAAPAEGEEAADAGDQELERAQRTEGLWSLVFYATRMLQRLYKQRAKRRAVSRIIWLFRMVETSSALKRAVLRFSTTLRSIPVRVKIYLSNKRKRHGEMEAQWATFEDDMLETHFRKLRAAVVKEAVQARKKSIGASKDDTIMEILESGGGVNWKQFRVPTHIRKDYIQQLYIDLMLQNQRAAAAMFKTVKRCYMEQAQMVNFLRRMGVEESEVDKAKSEMEPTNNPSTKRFWNMTDEDLEFAIRKLINEHCRDWVQHPYFVEEHELEAQRNLHGSKESAFSTSSLQAQRLPSKESKEQMEKKHLGTDPDSVQGEQPTGYTSSDGELYAAMKIFK